VTYDDAGWYFAEHDEDDQPTPSRCAHCGDWGYVAQLSREPTPCPRCDAARRFPIGPPA
jgi:rubrerythrin